jgi:phosphate transport system permease protein
MAQVQPTPLPLTTKRRLDISAEGARYTQRKWSNRIFATIVFLLTAASLLTLFIIVGTIIVRGIGVIFPTTNGVLSFNLDFFTKSSPADVNDPSGGYAHAILGSLEIVFVAALAAVPLGLGTAIYLSEYGQGAFAELVRFVLGMLAGLPSIVVGIVVWAILVRFVFHNFNGFAGAIALIIIMVPIIAISVESILRLVPDTLREAGLALGLPRWRVILRIVLPTVSGGVTTGIILAIARALGETAPLLLTDLGNLFFNFDLRTPVAALPLQVYGDAISGFDAPTAKSWAGTLLLVLIVGIVSASVRFVTRKSRYDN